MVMHLTYRRRGSAAETGISGGAAEFPDLFLPLTKNDL